MTITEEQYRVILDHFAGDEDRQLLMQLMWNIGCALVDACHLEWQDVMWDDCIIRSSRSKTAQRFRAPFEPGGELYQALKKRTLEPTYYPFGPISDRNRLSYRASRTSLYDEIRKAFRKAGLPKGVSTHTFRRTLITDMIKSGANPLDIMVVSGHRNQSMLRTYYTPDNVRLHDIARKARPLTSTHLPTAGPAPGDGSGEDQAGDTQGRAAPPVGIERPQV
jgi:integrase